jgi:serine/threonine-protein kinase
MSSPPPKKPPDDRWLQIQEILDRILDRPPGERDALIADLCAGDGELEREVLAYLRYEEPATEFLEEPLIDLVAGRPAASRLGEQLGPYRLEETIAEGGMGTVYRAARTDGVVERRVAVKILKRGFDTGAIVRGFRRERQILAGFTHPSVTRLIDGGATSDGLPYLVMEDVQGLRIDEHCDRHDLGIEQRLGLFAELCAAVQAAHARLVVHCDLKPSNVLVTGEGELKLLDFGIAKLLESEGELATRTLLLGLGSPPYASPEQHRGDRVSTATDVYSLGCILYRLLATRPPPRADQRRPEDPPLRPSEDFTPAPSSTPPDRGWIRRRRRRLRGDLDLIVQKATALEPSQRYASVLELGDDVRRFLEQRPVQARPESFAYLARRFVQRNRITVALVAALFASVAGGAIGLYAQLARTVEQRDRAVAMQELYLEFLEVVDPSRGESESEAVRTALSKLSRALGELSPADRAVVLDRMGRVLYRQEFLVEARELHLRALALRRGELPWNPHLLAASLNNLALVELELGNQLRAGELLNESLHLQGSHGIRSEVGWLDKVNNLALVLERSAPEKAEPLFRRVLEGQERNHGRRSPEVATALNNLGQNLVRRGRYGEAAPLLQEAHDLRRELLGEDHPATVTTLANLAVLWSAREQTDRALAAAREVLERRREASGVDHPSTARAQNALAFILLREGSPESLAEAEERLRRAISIYRAQRGGKHAATLVFERNLAAVLLARGRPKEARRRLDDLLPRAEEVFPTDHWRLADVRSLWGEVLLSLGDVDPARRLIADSVPAIAAATGESSPYARDARRRLEAVEEHRRTATP